MSHNDIIRQIREASAFEHSASKYDDKYEQTMKSAGASMYGAFKDGLLSQPEYRGKEMNDKAIRNIYESTKPRPWWDALLLEAGYRRVDGKDSSKSSRLQGASILIQWHLNPTAAAKNRGNQIIAVAKRREIESKKQGGKETRSERSDQVPSHAPMSERSHGHAEPAKFEGMRESSQGGGALPQQDGKRQLLDVLAEIKALVNSTPEHLQQPVLDELIAARDTISEMLG